MKGIIVMAVGRIYVNEAGPDVVAADFSGSPAYVTSPNNCSGYALKKTLEHLGLAVVKAAKPPINARLHIAGTVDTIRDHLPELDWHTGFIAKQASALGSEFTRPWDYRAVEGIIGRLIDKTLPKLLPEAYFMQVVGEVIKPFADEEMGHDLLEVHYGVTRSAYGYDLEPFAPEATIVKPNIGEIYVQG